MSSYNKMAKVYDELINEDINYKDIADFLCENIFEDEIVEMDLTFFVREGAVYERFNEIHEERAYTEELIESIFKEVGFKMISKNDGYSDKEVEEKTERILYILKK